MILALFDWFWLIANLAVLWLALTRKLNPIFRSLIVLGAVLGAAAGFSNALVMTVNGWRMPVETVADWDDAPNILSDPEDVGRFYCRAFVEFDPPADSWGSRGVHVDVPPSRPAATPPDTEARELFRPRLAFLDDRHPFVICGENAIVSKGDVMGALGAILIAPGALFILLGFAWRKLRRK